MDRERFRALVLSLNFDPDSCWIFPRALTDKGCTRVYFEGKQIHTHQASYITFVGQVPEGKNLDHTCHKPEICDGGVGCSHRACINPSHLEPVTFVENILRGAGPSAKNSRKKLCHKGHKLFFDPHLGHRRCKTCARESRLRRFPPKPVETRICCENGHPYLGNERIDNRGRVCRECARLRTAAYRARQKSSVSL